MLQKLRLSALSLLIHKPVVCQSAPGHTSFSPLLSGLTMLPLLLKPSHCELHPILKPHLWAFLWRAVQPAWSPAPCLRLGIHGLNIVRYRPVQQTPDNIWSVYTAVFQTEAGLTHFCQGDMLKNNHFSCSGGGEVPRSEHQGTASDNAALTLLVLVWWSFRFFFAQPTGLNKKKYSVYEA